MEDMDPNGTKLCIDEGYQQVHILTVCHTPRKYNTSKEFNLIVITVICGIDKGIY